MSVGTLFGFDEVLQGIVQAYPEVRLHIARSDEKTLATASSSGLVAIATGTVGEAPGPIVRTALTDLRGRLVARDQAVAEASEQASTDATHERLKTILERLGVVEDQLATLEDRTMPDLLNKLESCEIDEFQANSEALREARVSFRELTAEFEQLEEELCKIDPDGDLREELF